MDWKEIKKHLNKWNLIQKIFIPISSALYVLWLFGIFMQFIYVVIIDKDYSLLLTYGQITLTLFGFSLIGGIFEKEKGLSSIEIKLFDMSISFLVTSIAFFYLYSILPIYFNEDILIFGSTEERLLFVSIAFSLLVAIVGLIGGFIAFLQYLLDYRKKINNKKRRRNIIQWKIRIR